MIPSDPSQTYIIAEAGVNHNGDRDLAFALIDAAAAAGADAVKFQTFNARKLAAASAPKAAYQKLTTQGGESQLAMLSQLELPLDWHAPLQAYANTRDIAFISTAFDTDSLAFLVKLDIPFFKIPSGELTNGPLLWQFARTGKPLVLSTGMSTLSEVEQGLAVVTHALSATGEPATMTDVWHSWSDPAARSRLKGHVALLHCTSQYPTPLEEANIRAMDTLRDAFRLDVGYSDHTQGILMPLVAVARGARIIEKHFTTDRTLPGPDHQASLEPEELTRMVADIRAVAVSLGTGSKAPQRSEWDTRQAARQQIAAARDLPQGHVITREDLTTARLGEGLAPSELWRLVGQTTNRTYAAGDPVLD
jgi:N-acetylneuraminate synthase